MRGQNRKLDKLYARYEPTIEPLPSSDDESPLEILEEKEHWINEYKETRLVPDRHNETNIGPGLCEDWYFPPETLSNLGEYVERCIASSALSHRLDGTSLVRVVITDRDTGNQPVAV